MNVNSEFYNHLGFLFGSIGVILGVFFGIIMIFRKGKFTANANIFLGLYLLCFGLRMGKSLFHYYYFIETAILNIFLSIFLVIGPLVWLYCFHLIKNKTKLNTLYTYLHFIPFFLSVILSAYIPAIYQPYSWVFYFFIFAHGLMYSLYALYWVLRSQRFYENVSKGKIVKNWLTIFIASTIVIYINAVLIYFNIVPFYPSSSFVFSVVLLILIICGFYSFDVFSSDMEKYKNSSLNKDAALDYSNELKRLMNDDKPFLNPELTLTSLSKTLGITSKQLSQIINQVEGKNYSQYIAELRVYQAVELLKTNKYKHYTMAAIAYECGFSSISSFNIAFKKITGKTPVQYKQTVKVY